MPVDPATGQVYTETIVSAQEEICWKCERWFTITKLRPNDAIEYGGPSLEDTAMKQLLRNLHELPSNALVGLSKSLREKLYHAVVRKYHWSLPIWKQFVLLDEPLANKSFSISFSCGCVPLQSFLRRLRKATNQVDLKLSFERGASQPSDLLALRQLDNLTVLRVTRDTNCLDNRIVRGWLSLQPGVVGLENLLTLVVLGQTMLTRHCLADLRQLPKLRHVVAVNCGFMMDELTAVPEPGWLMIDPEKHPSRVSTDWQGYLSRLDPKLASEYGIFHNPVLDSHPHVNVDIGEEGKRSSLHDRPAIILRRTSDESMPERTKRAHSEIDHKPQTPARSKRNARLGAALQAMVSSTQ